MTATRLFKHNPAFLTEEELESSFVVRHAELRIILDIVRENEGPANQHIIIIGPRGTGKTMLVRRLALAIKADESLSRTWYPVVLPEEVYGVAAEGELWLEVLKYIATQEKTAGRDYQRWLQSYKAIGKELDDRRRKIHSLSALSEFSREHGLKLLVVMENLQLVLGEQTSSDEAWNLRRTLSNNPEIMLVTTATTHFKEIANVKKANYELFREIPLDPLSTDDCRILWRSVADENLVNDRIRPMEILTGGSPRLLTILADFAKGRSLAQLMDDLVVLIDDHTTYFKANVESLPPKERRVFVTLAELWKPVEARQVAARCRLAVNITSALLKKLVMRGAVTEAGKVGRKNLYQIAERLYNIYHLMRLSNIEADRVRALVRFMIPLYGEETLACALATEACNENTARRSALIEGYKEILSSAAIDSHSLERIYQVTPKTFLSLPETAEITGKFEDIKFQKEIISLKQKADRALQAGDIESFADHQDSLLLHYGDSQDLASLGEVAGALFNKGFALGSLGRSEEAIAVYDEVVSRFADVDEPALRVLIAGALVIKGIMLESLGRSEELISVYDEVVSRFGDMDDPALRGQVARALVNKGVTLGSLDRNEEAIAVYDEVVSRFADMDEPALRGEVARALNQRARRVYEKEDYGMLDQAAADIKKALSIDPENTYRHTLACLLALQSQWDDALAQARYFADDESMIREHPGDIIDFFIFAAASNKAEEALQAVGKTKIESAMEPLIAALSISAGRQVRAPREVLEVAKDILERIKKKVESAKQGDKKSLF
ncbi:MAG: ATP-binding protein [Thermodesulfobacteriota bacterium]|nr:ATP-binding protein [Thermodesulfobacteriota bacterium]